MGKSSKLSSWENAASADSSKNTYSGETYEQNEKEVRGRKNKKKEDNEETLSKRPGDRKQVYTRKDIFF